MYSSQENYEKVYAKRFIQSSQFCQSSYLENLEGFCLRDSIREAKAPLSSFPRRRESKTLYISWIPGRASYRQLARNDVRMRREDYASSTLGLKSE
jgi:hypothetical protein